MATLEQKQEDFEYRSPADLYVHGEPFSPADWNKELLKIGGRCPFGDARLRIVWGGTEKKHGFLQTDKGSVEAMVIKYAAQIPHVRKLVGYSYKDDAERYITVRRLDQVPEGKIPIPKLEYMQLGMLRWVLERKFTLDELIAMQMYPDPKSEKGREWGRRGGRRYAYMPDQRGLYVGLYPLQTPDGKYFEPDADWFTTLRKTQREIESVTEQDKIDLMNRELDRIEEAERRAEQAEKDAREEIWEESIIEVEKAPQGRIIFT